MCCSLPVPRSLAETFTMPLASMSKVTSICGTPRRRRSDAVELEAAEASCCTAAISRSPCRTLTSTEVWLSAAVEKIWLFLVGMVVLRSMSLVNTPPRVSMPRDSGVTSSRSNALDVAAEHAALDGRADGHALVGVDALEAVLAGELLDRFLHGGDTAGTADQQDLVRSRRGEAGVGHGLTHRAYGRLDQVGGQLVELGAGEGHVEVLRAGGVGGDVGQVDVAWWSRRTARSSPSRPLPSGAAWPRWSPERSMPSLFLNSSTR